MCGNAFQATCSLFLHLGPANSSAPASLETLELAQLKDTLAPLQHTPQAAGTLPNQARRPLRSMSESPRQQYAPTAECLPCSLVVRPRAKVSEIHRICRPRAFRLSSGFSRRLWRSLCSGSKQLQALHHQCQFVPVSHLLFRCHPQRVAFQSKCRLGDLMLESRLQHHVLDLQYQRFLSGTF